VTAVFTLCTLRVTATDYWKRAEVPAGPRGEYNGNYKVMTMLQFQKWGYARTGEKDLCSSSTKTSFRPVILPSARNSQDGSVVFVACRQMVYRVEIDYDGYMNNPKELYSSPTDITGELMTDVTGQYLLITTAISVTVVESGTGQVHWSRTGISTVGSAVIGTDKVYVQTSSNQVCAYSMSSSGDSCVDVGNQLESSLYPLVDSNGHAYVCGKTSNKVYQVEFIGSGYIAGEAALHKKCVDFILSAENELIVVDDGNYLYRIDTSSMSEIASRYVSTGKINALARSEIRKSSQVLKKLYLSQATGVSVVESDNFAIVYHERSSSNVQDAPAVTFGTDFVFASRERLIGVPVNEDGNPVVYFQEAQQGEIPKYKGETRPLWLNRDNVFMLTEDGEKGLVFSLCEIYEQGQEKVDGVVYCPNILYNPDEEFNWGLIIAGSSALFLLPLSMYGCKRAGFKFKRC